MTKDYSKTIIMLILSVILVFGIVTLIYVKVINKPKEASLKPINYPILVKLGLSPSANPRYALSKDIYTGLSAVLPDGSKYGLFESRYIETGDFGKTFISPLED